MIKRSVGSLGLAAAFSAAVLMWTDGAYAQGLGIPPAPTVSTRITAAAPTVGVRVAATVVPPIIPTRVPLPTVSLSGSNPTPAIVVPPPPAGGTGSSTIPSSGSGSSSTLPPAGTESSSTLPPGGTVGAGADASTMVSPPATGPLPLPDTGGVSTALSPVVNTAGTAPIIGPALEPAVSTASGTASSAISSAPTGDLSPSD